jgi:bacillithiol biosynthesis cysteine-adding enzyme BshC
MFQKSSIPFEHAGTVNKLVLDYLHKKKETNSFYCDFPNEDGFRNAVKRISAASYNRNVLVSSLLAQSKTVANTSADSLKNIELLKKDTTYTVTTGHQLCLFTGPLYFFYKIISTIALAEKLKKQFPQNDLVPVYWLAGEDHDFEEVNHFYLFGKKLQWENTENGSVGDKSTEGLKKVYEEMKTILGEGKHSNALLSLFERSYLQHKDLKTATRFLANELFGKYGLVIVDGDDKALKELAVDLFSQDIFEHKALALVEETNKEFENSGYKTQVTPREINCFYKTKGLRARIEKKGDGFLVTGTDLKFSSAEMNSLIKDHPENISPNVVLRPLYQQQILPNLAYVGGPGELNYWLQYKRMFDFFKVQFPVLVLRSMITIADKQVNSKIEKLGITPGDLFKSEDELIKTYLNKQDQSLSVEKEKKKISEVFSELKNKISAIDKTLEATVGAEEKKVFASIDNLAQRGIKALKLKEEVSVNQLKQAKEKIFPGGEPQERVDNFSTYYFKWGAEFLDLLKDSIEPLQLEHVILRESQP